MKQAISTIKKMIITIVLMLTSMQVFAQTNQTEPTRKGFVIGVSAGAGYLSIEGDSAPEVFEGGDISLPNLKIGWMLTPNTALLLSMPGMAYEANGVGRSFDGLVPSVQHWVRPNWWINGGVGLGLDTPAFFEDEVKGQDKLILGPSFMISTGYEVYKKGKFTIDLQGTIHAGRLYSNDTHYDAGAILAGVGFNFY